MPSQPFFENPMVWLLSQSVAFVVAMLWAASERRAKNLERMERIESQKRNEELSDACIQLVAKHSAELVAKETLRSNERLELERRQSKELVRREELHSALLDSSLRNVLMHCENLLDKISLELRKRSARDTDPPPTPRVV